MKGELFIFAATEQHSSISLTPVCVCVCAASHTCRPPGQPLMRPGQRGVGEAIGTWEGYCPFGQEWTMSESEKERERE